LTVICVVLENQKIEIYFTSRITQILSCVSYVRITHP